MPGGGAFRAQVLGFQPCRLSGPAKAETPLYNATQVMHQVDKLPSVNRLHSSIRRKALHVPNNEGSARSRVCGSSPKKALRHSIWRLSPCGGGVAGGFSGCTKNEGLTSKPCRVHDEDHLYLCGQVAKVCEIAHTCDIMAWETVVQSGQHAESAWVLVAGRVQRVVIEEETRRSDDHNKYWSWLCWRWW